MRKYQYYNTNDDDDRDGYTANWMAQTFTIETAHLLGKIKLKLFRVGDPGTITVSIKVASAGKPVGADLCSGTIEGTDITLVTTGEWYEISLGDGFSLDANVQYAIVIKAPSGDASNKVSWRADITDPTFTGGTFVSSSDSGVDWGIVSGVDCMFEEWGVGPPSPTTVTWGNLLKSQISAEKIEEAITRMLQDHEDDPDAHIEIGESLQSHKASEIIDHVVDSIIADKIKDWEVIKLGGSFDRTDFHWFTFFESLDGFYQATYGDGAVTLNTSYLELASGAADPGWAMIVEDVGIYDLFSWDKKRRVRTRVLFSSITEHVVSIANGLAENLPAQRCIRFLIDNGAVHGYVSNGSAETDLDLSFNLVAATAYNLEIRFFPAEKVEFYIDGVLKGTITTNIPAGTSDAGIMMYIRIGNWYGAGSKYIRLSYFDVWQET